MQQDYSFKLLKEKSSNGRVPVALMLDEMSIKKHVWIDSEDKFSGYVDIGANFG